MQVPKAWSQHSWHGTGSPDAGLVASLRQRLRGKGSLPPAVLLTAWPDLEASASRALDLEASSRVPCIFHADDPIFLSSSRGGLLQMLRIVASWCVECGAKFHVAPKKSVAMCAGTLRSSTPVVSFPTSGGPVALTWVSCHRWLGILWPDSLDFRMFLLARLAVASAAVAQLAGLATMHAVPWLAVLQLFEAKVDSLMDLGRWLVIMVPDAEAILDEAYGRWACSLLGADWWRNKAVCCSELGCRISAFARVVKAVALRRARLEMRDSSDWHAGFFHRAEASAYGWAARSRAVLNEWDITTWSEWCVRGSDLVSYKNYVEQRLILVCQERWKQAVSKHNAQVPYYLFENSPGVRMQSFRSSVFSVAFHSGLRSWCRLRYGIIVLRHLEGRASAARFQHCIFCDRPLRNATVHVIGLCSHWNHRREEFGTAASVPDGASCQVVTQKFFNGSIPSLALELAVSWAAQIDKDAFEYWHSRPR